MKLLQDNKKEKKFVTLDFSNDTKGTIYGVLEKCKLKPQVTIRVIRLNEKVWPYVLVMRMYRNQNSAGWSVRKKRKEGMKEGKKEMVQPFWESLAAS